MEEAQLLNLLTGCLDPVRIKASEEALNLAKRSPTFVQSLLTLLSKGFQDQQILIMAMSCYRKFLEEYYGNPKEPLPEAVRQLVRSTVLDMYYSISHCQVAVSLYKEILRIVIAVSYPWPGLDLVNPNKVQASIYFYRQVSRIYQHLVAEKDRAVIENFVSSYFPYIESVVEKIMQNYSNDTAKLLCEVLQMFLSVIHLEMPAYLKDLEHVSKWVFFAKAILGAPLQAKELAWCWRVREEAVKIVLKLMQQYCDHHLDGKKDGGWRGLFAQRFGSELLSCSEALFAFAKASYMSEQLLSLLLKVFYYALKNERIRPQLVPRCENLLFEYLLPAIDVRDSDYKQLEQDPLQYIRREEDLSANIIKRSAVDVIDMLSNLNLNNKSFLIRFVQYAATSLLDPNVASPRKATVVYMIGYLHSKILGNQFLGAQIDKFISQYLLPFLKSHDSVLLSTTCEVLSIYLKKISLDKSAMEPVVSELYNCLTSKLLVVRYKAILAFTSLLEHQQAVSIVKPHFTNILSIYIKILDELDHEKLLISLQSMVSKFEQEISQMGDKLIEHMIRMFMKYSVRKEIQQDDNDEQEEEAHNAATAALSTIRQILKTGLISNMYFQLSSQLIELFVYILDNDLEYMTEMVQVMAALLSRAEKICDYTFLYLLFRKLLDGKLLPNSLQCPRLDLIDKIDQATDDIDEILSVLKNMVRQMPTELLNSYPLPTNPGLLLCLIENKIIRPEQFANLDTSEVDASWNPTLQSYLAMIYNIGSLAATDIAIRSVPNGVSLYPWICGINDPGLFALVIRKAVGRVQVSQEQQDDNEDTIQKLHKYSAEQYDDIEDADYNDNQPLYNYMYRSLFDADKDIQLIHDKLRSIADPAASQLILNHLTKNEVSKLQKLLQQ